MIYFHTQACYRFCRKKTPRWGVLGKKRDRLSAISLCWHYLFSHAGVRSSLCARKQSGGLFAAKKNLRPFDRRFVLALSIFTRSHPRTIVDAPELNFCVRDGNRWTLKPINTNFQDCTLKTEHSLPQSCFPKVFEPAFFRSSPRHISIGQLNTLPCLHPRPINVIVYDVPYSFRMGDLISGGVSRLDAFSVYLVQT